MDVKFSFLNGELQEEVYIEHREGFQLTKKPDYVCILKKAFYGLKQASRAWYSKLDNYLLKRGFKRGAADSNLYVKAKDNKLIVVVVYVNDIIFSSDSDSLTNEFADDMKVEFKISMLGELHYFLRLHIAKVPKGIFISQGNYLK